MNLCREDLLLYAITDRSWTGEQTLLQQLEQALQGGVSMVQLREKGLEEDAFVAQAVQGRQLCRRYGVPLIVNDNVDVALKSGADGVHVGAQDAPVETVRRRAGSGFLIGATAKTVAQAQAAQRAGADYLGVGAVFPSPTKRDALRISVEQLRTICASVSIPVVAIGGISQENIGRLVGSGAAGVAVISALFSAGDICAAARALRRGAEESTG
ncbi:MAG: thiamine phosphate synthase [Oscillospiraceae bacterium]|nr:thiamine phosphate synthase [Oscillospiraceae bacterium]